MDAESSVVAFLGPKASYTHQATLDYFDDSKYTLVPQVSIEDVFQAVQSGEVAQGVVPFENSTNGSVVFTLDLFADLHKKYPDILVCGEAFIDVHHCVVGHTRTSDITNVLNSPDSSGYATPTASHPVPAIPRTAPLASLQHIRKLYSHPQAWGQCNNFLSAYLKGVERQDVSSTSRAAELVAQDPSGETAAISSEIAGRMNGLNLLARNIEDTADNKTRFFILRRGQHVQEETSAPGADAQVVSQDDAETQAYKTLVAFTIDNGNPGALADSLTVFKPYKINLTSINARPSGAAPWSYIFFVELTGRRLAGDRGAVNAALRDLTKVAHGWRWLGSWKNRNRSDEKGMAAIPESV